MIKTIPQDIILNLLVGESLAFAARGRISRGDNPIRSGLGAGLLLILVTFIPFALFYLIGYPDWSWVYLFDPAGSPALFRVLIPAAYLAAMCVGFLVSRTLIKRESTRGVQGLMIVTALVLVIVSVLVTDRVLVVGTYAEYRSGRAVSLFRDRLLWVILVMGAIFLPAWAYALRRLRKT